MSAGESLQHLSLRLDAMERQNRRLRLGLLALGVLFLCGVLGAGLGRTAPARVEARHFILTDDHGGMRGEWSIDSDGAARLRIYGQDGKEEASLPPSMRVVPVR